MFDNVNDVQFCCTESMTETVSSIPRIYLELSKKLLSVFTGEVLAILTLRLCVVWLWDSDVTTWYPTKNWTKAQKLLDAKVQILWHTICVLEKGIPLGPALGDFFSPFRQGFDMYRLALKIPCIPGCRLESSCLNFLSAGIYRPVPPHPALLSALIKI